jgi:hypothetical protein
VKVHPTVSDLRSVAAGHEDAAGTAENAEHCVNVPTHRVVDDDADVPCFEDFAQLVRCRVRNADEPGETFQDLARTRIAALEPVDPVFETAACERGTSERRRQHALTYASHSVQHGGAGRAVDRLWRDFVCSDGVTPAEFLWQRLRTHANEEWHDNLACVPRVLPLERDVSFVRPVSPHTRTN